MLNQKQTRNHRFSTLAAIKAVGNGNDFTIAYCDETETQYKWLDNGSAYTADDQYVLITGAGGNTRWIGIAGQYVDKPPIKTDNLMWSFVPTFNGDVHIIGWHNLTDTAVSLVSATPITLSEPAYHSHVVLDISSASGLPFTIRLTGTSVNESTGALTPSDTEDIDVTANGYYQSSKSFITACQVSIVESSKSCTLDAYRTTYYDMGNRDFIVDGCRLEFMPDQPNWHITLQVMHFSNDGSFTYIENITLDKDDNPPRAGVYLAGKYKRGNYSQTVLGSQNEGIVIQLDQEGIGSFMLELKVRV